MLTVPTTLSPHEQIHVILKLLTEKKNIIYKYTYRYNICIANDVFCLRLLICVCLMCSPSAQLSLTNDEIIQPLFMAGCHIIKIIRCAVVIQKRNVPTRVLVLPGCMR